MYVTLLRIAPILVAGVFGWYVGSSVTKADYEHTLHQAAEASAVAQIAAVEAANREAEARSERSLRAAEARGRKSGLAQGVIHEIAADTNLDCEWRDEHRLRILDLYHAYGFTPSGTPAGVPD